MSNGKKYKAHHICYKGVARLSRLEEKITVPVRRIRFA